MQPTFNFRGIAANNQALRGMARSIGHVRSVDEALEAAGLNWNVARRPYLIQGKETNKPSRFKALVRSDDGYELGPCTEQYTPIQNRDLLRQFFTVAEGAGVKLTQAGCYDGGARVFATSEFPNHSFTLPISRQWTDAMRRNPDHGWAAEDKTTLQLVMASGHTPGLKAQFFLQAYRLVCLNAAKVSRNLGEVGIAHRGNVKEALEAIGELVSEAANGFDDYRKQAEILRSTQSSAEVDRAYVVNLLAPEAFSAIMAETEAQVHGTHAARLTGTDLLNAVIDRTYTARFETALAARSVAAVLDAIQSQPGAAMAQGTLWNTYNAVTYQVDHRAGRNIDAAVESSLFGSGSKLKIKAMDLALQYARASGTRGAAGGKASHA